MPNKTIASMGFFITSYRSSGIRDHRIGQDFEFSTSANNLEGTSLEWKLTLIQTLSRH